MAIGIIMLAAAAAAAAPEAAKPVPVDPGSWITADDYPSAAILAGKEGKVAFRLNVDSAGAVTGCAITGSSGFDPLDAATCDLVRKRARFQPAHDRRGGAVASTWSSAVAWRMERDTADSGFAVTTYEVTPDGRVLSCRTSAEAGAKIAQDPCAGDGTGNQAWLRKYAPRYSVLRLQSGNKVAATLPALPGPDWGELIARRLDIMTVVAPSRLIACDIVASEGPPDFRQGVCSVSKVAPTEPGDADKPKLRMTDGWAIYGVRR